MKGSEHPLKIYYSVYVALLVLTAATVAIAFKDWGTLNIVFAGIIAVAKAAIVVLFFMHLRWTSALTRLFAVAGFLWLGIMIGLTLSDYLTRHWQVMS